METPRQAPMPPDQTSDDHAVQALRAVLMAPGEPPPGLVVRMQARVRRAREAHARITRDARIVMGALVFSVIAFRGNTETLVVGAVVAMLYCALAERGSIATVSPGRTYAGQRPPEA
jgi:hypothetical protein